MRLAGERDARLEHICWRVWTMRRRAAELALRADADGRDTSVVPELKSLDEADDSGDVDDEEITKLYGAPPGAAAAAVAPSLRKLSIPQRGRAGAAAAAAELLSESSDDAAAGGGGGGAAASADGPGTPLPGLGGSPTAGGLLAPPPDADEGLNLGEGRVPRLYCVLISMHGLLRGDRMELGKDPDTGGQVRGGFGGACFGGTRGPGAARCP